MSLTVPMWCESFKNQGHVASYFVSLMVGDLVHGQTLMNGCWINDQVHLYPRGFGA